MGGYYDIPDIYYDNNNNNPCVSSPNAPYAIFFYQTRETLFGDADIFKKFIENAIKQFRSSETYTQYKSTLFDLGLDRCQIHGNITVEMVGAKGLEMHHNGLTIFDIAVMLTNHILNVKGKVCTFDIISELKYVHTNHLVPLVMISKTDHEMYHNNEEYILPASLCFGNWIKLITDYMDGVTFGIAKKLYYWIELSLEHSIDDKLNADLIGVRDKILEWSDYNGYAFNNNKYNIYDPSRNKPNSDFFSY